MILDKNNQSFFYEGKIYFIGQHIVGTKESEYEGLFGTITEIRDSDDKDTDNTTPDIYCSFEAPQMPYDIKTVEARFSKLYNEPKTLDDIIFDSVIMAPEMIDPFEENIKYQKVYVITEDWAHNNDRGVSYKVVSSKEEAKRQMRLIFKNELINGFLPKQLSEEGFKVESYDHCYDAYLEGYAEAEHYTLYFEEHNMAVDSAFLSFAYSMYKNEAYKEDFKSQTDEMPGFARFTEEEYQRVISEPSIPERIQNELEKNDAYWSAYYQSIHNVAQNMLKLCGV